MERRAFRAVIVSTTRHWQRPAATAGAAAGVAAGAAGAAGPRQNETLRCHERRTETVKRPATNNERTPL